MLATTRRPSTGSAGRAEPSAATQHAALAGNRYAGLDQWETARSYMKQHRTNFPKFSIAGWKVAFPHSNPAVSKQRLRLEALLRQPGAPETPPDDKGQTGLVQ